MSNQITVERSEDIMAVKLSDEARELRNAYMREWRRKNKERVKQTQANHWERKAEELRQEREKEQQSK